MRQLFQHTLLSFFILLLAACGGGGSFDGGSTGGGTTPTPVTRITLTLVDPASNEAINEITTASPGRLNALVTIDNVPQSGVKVDFSLPDSVGELSQTSKLTGDDGIAFVTLNAGTITNAGTAVATYNGEESSPLAFNVTVSIIDSNVEIVMSDITATPDSIGANGTATLSVSFTQTENGETTPLAQSVPVDFTSDCSILPTSLAMIDTGVTTQNGVATATYQDQGCGREDTIRVRATIGQESFSKETTLNVAAAELGSIEFKSATPEVIALKGSGGAARSETSSLVFVVKDDIGNAVRDTAVNFVLSTTVGGITMSPGSQAKTNADGEVTVIVAAGSVPTPVRVTATLDADPTVSTISDLLSISSGIADDDSFSISATNLSPEAWNIDGTEVSVNARLADHFNNPVPDGTVVNFSTEFGAVQPQCSTVGGACSVTWTSQSPRGPEPAFRDAQAISRSLNGTQICYDGDGNVTTLSNTLLPCPGTLGQVYSNRVSIFAYTLGQETFTDSNSNGRYDDGEAFTDLTDAFRDDNEDGFFSGRLGDGSAAAGATLPNYTTYEFGKPNAGQVHPGGDNDEFFDDDSMFNPANGLYNGGLCNDDREGCTTELITISDNIVILQSGSDAHISIIEADPALSIWNNANYFQPVQAFGIIADDPATPEDESARVGVTKQLTVYVSDVNNGMMPAGTTVEFETTNGTVESDASVTIAGTNDHGIFGVNVIIKGDDEAGSGLFTVKVTSPSGVVTRSRGIVIND